ncbi:hypothetical protein ACLIYP_22160 [Streptomyces nanhaiensis]|uniref:hypothetical protein n=1 Tax=Streptomyces nanhaiensis TaxID=679319 RepID=UPI00399CDE6F
MPPRQREPEGGSHHHGQTPVTVVIDHSDHPAFTAAALDAHAPAAGRITVHPTPAVGTAAALAQDVLHALGKTVIGTREQHGTWADSLHPPWNAACAWTSAHGIDHLIVTRAHQLTTRRLHQLLGLRRRNGIRLTLLWHTRPTSVLATALDGTAYRLTEDLPTALTQPQQPRHTPARHGTAGRPHDQPLPGRHQTAWISPPRPSRGQVVPRPPRVQCPGAEQPCSAITPATAAEPDDHDQTTGHLTARLHTLAHPLHAAAPAAATLTGAGLERLALIRGTDIDTAATHLKTHDSPAHRRCRLHPLPTWARPLLNAAARYHHLDGRPPDAALLPLVTARNGIHLATCTKLLRLRLPTPTSTHTEP